MTITYVGNTTVPTGTGTNTGGSGNITVSIPASELGDLLVLFLHQKPETNDFTTPDAWTAVSDANAAGGGGTTGADTGPTRAKAFYRMGGTSATTLTITQGSHNCTQGIICTLRSDVPDTVWSVAGANGIDTTTGTPFTAAMNVDPNITTNDMVLVWGGIPTDVTTPAQFSAETLTAAGLTSGSVTEIAEPETTQGNDLGAVLCRWTPTGGPSSGVATFSATAGGTTTNVRGPIILVRARDTAAAAQVPGPIHQRIAA